MVPKVNQRLKILSTLQPCVYLLRVFLPLPACGSLAPLTSRLLSPRWQKFWDTTSLFVMLEKYLRHVVAFRWLMMSLSLGQQRSLKKKVKSWDPVMPYAYLPTTPSLMCLLFKAHYVHRLDISESWAVARHTPNASNA